MCSKTNNDNNKSCSFPTLDYATTAIGTTKTSTNTQSCTSNDACMRYCYQFKPNYQKSSNRTAKTPANATTATATAAAAAAAYATRAKCRRICYLVTLFAIGLMSSSLSLTTITKAKTLSTTSSLLFAWCGSGFIIGAHAAPQSCTLCDKEDLKAKDPSTSYEEYFFEHQVTRYDAINALKSLNDSFYVGPSPENSCKSVNCDKKTMKYCLGPKFINDHCWCELGHIEEGLPFVPHICYVGEKKHTVSVGSCFFYEEVKECCCAPALAKQWRHISGAPRESLSHYLFLLTIGHILFKLGQRLTFDLVT